jgi:protein gp37
MATKIEWAEETLNVVTGCTEASPGCANCYARKMSKRLIAMGQEKYAGTVDAQGRWTGVVRFHPEVLDVPAKWRKPRRVFLNSMSDTFHAEVGVSDVARMLNMILSNQKHTFIIATKRAARAKRAINLFCDSFLEGNPIPNLHLLVSVENQLTANTRIPHILQTNVIVRGLSMEPLLSDVNISEIRAQDGLEYLPLVGTTSPKNKLHWIIVGGESGPNARPMDPAWVRSIRDQCVSAGVPFFFKQWGAWTPEYHEGAVEFRPYEQLKNMYRVGKKRAGRQLDGREWNEMPGESNG